MPNIQSAAVGFNPVPGGELYLNTDQDNLVSGVPTKVELDTVNGEWTDGIEDTGNHRILPGVAGRYLVIGQVMFTNVIAGKKYEANVQRSGAQRITGYKYSSLTENLTIRISSVLILTAIQYLELWAVSNADVDTVDIKSGMSYTHLTVQRVG